MAKETTFLGKNAEAINIIDGNTKKSVKRLKHNNIVIWEKTRGVTTTIDCKNIYYGDTLNVAITLRDETNNILPSSAGTLSLYDENGALIKTFNTINDITYSKNGLEVGTYTYTYQFNSNTKKYNSTKGEIKFEVYKKELTLSIKNTNETTVGDNIIKMHRGNSLCFSVKKDGKEINYGTNDNGCPETGLEICIVVNGKLYTRTNGGIKINLLPGTYSDFKCYIKDTTHYTSSTGGGVGESNAINKYTLEVLQYNTNNMLTPSSALNMAEGNINWKWNQNWEFECYNKNLTTRGTGTAIAPGQSPKVLRINYSLDSVKNKNIWGFQIAFAIASEKAVITDKYGGLFDVRTKPIQVTLHVGGWSATLPSQAMALNCNIHTCWHTAITNQSPYAFILDNMVGKNDEVYITFQFPTNDQHKGDEGYIKIQSLELRPLIA